MKKVAAVIVTFNRIQLLKECISALLEQIHKLDTIIVVNNGSTDGTHEYLNSLRNIQAIHQENTGGAGGFARGMYEAYKQGYDWIWAMDDDGFPNAPALKELLNFPSIGPCILNCLVLDKNDPTKLAFSLQYNQQLVKTISSLNEITALIGSINPFNGTLISRDVFHAIGFPRGEMFIWGDETEFCTRAIKYGFPVVTVCNSYFYHPPAREIMNSDWNYDVTWKKYYSIRNHSLILRNTKGKIHHAYYLKSFTLTIADLIKFQKTRKLIKTIIAFEAFFDAIIGNYKKYPKDIKTLKLFTKWK